MKAEGFLVTRYEYYLIRNIVLIVIGFLTIVFFSINIINDFLTDEIRVNPKSYTLKEGYPLFHDAEEYLKLIKDYPHDIGIKLQIYTVKDHETLWEAAFRNKISIETLLAANPFLTSLTTHKGMKLVIPSKDGILLACDDVDDAERMANEVLYPYDDIQGDFFNHIFNIYCRDNLRLVFIPGKKPIIVNNFIEGIYLQKMNFNPPLKGYFSSMYGSRRDPFTGAPDFHDGIDISNRPGTPIKPVKNGVVAFSGWKKGYGNVIKLLHEDGYISLYAHCSKLLVNQGDIVKADDVIALVGSTGRSTGPHLHLEMHRHGKTMDPIFFIW